jgi:hypothetical protein
MPKRCELRKLEDPLITKIVDKLAKGKKEVTYHTVIDSINRELKKIEKAQKGKAPVFDENVKRGIMLEAARTKIQALKEKC